ncbi:MAG: hexitol phosphatase HxpB [Sphingobacteriales bacterium]|nr:MAG: hexitol phosphatase HxpB [Sphingobacteriales bacterium]
MAVIFDMDGLMLDTDPVIWLESMHQVAARCEVAVTTELLKHTKGLRIYEVTGFWNEHFGWKDPAKALKMAEDILDTVISISHTKGKILPGAVNLLEVCKKENIAIGLATSSPQRLVDSLLDHFGLRHYFSCISTADNCRQGKPHPEVYLNCAGTMQVLPWRCVAFEDSVNGMVAAKAARMQVVAVPEASHYNDRQFGLADLKLLTLEGFTLKDYYRLLEL